MATIGEPEKKWEVIPLHNPVPARHYAARSPNQTRSDSQQRDGYCAVLQTLYVPHPEQQHRAQAENLLAPAP